MISIHAPHAGRDPNLSAVQIHSVALFQSTRPMRGATISICTPASNNCDFNPRAPCGARLLLCGRSSFRSDFNPRAPCGARLITALIASTSSVFQSTRPMRGATAGRAGHPRPRRISIHAPHAGRDGDIGGLGSMGKNFNPRAPCGARPCFGKDQNIFGVISIHAPHAGRDRPAPNVAEIIEYFNPRAPCGARPSLFLRVSGVLQSTRYFNPRAPCGARLRSQSVDNRE